MYTVLLSGGSGKRLWPLSNNINSKQYLKLFHKEDETNATADNSKCSMIQRIWGQLEQAGLSSNLIITACSNQTEIIREQLGDVEIAVEPTRRDTFPAVALSCSYLVSCMRATPEETVIILPVDSYTEKEYFETVKKLERVLLSGMDVALLGTKPTYPSLKYTYIVPKSIEGNGRIEVDGYIEGQDVASTENLIGQGALWSCGVYCFRIGFILDKLKEYGVSAEYSELYKEYDKLPKTSFDYEVLKNTKKLAAIEYKGMWKKLGTWNTFTEEIVEKDIGNVAVGEGTEGTHVINELSIPIVTLGAKNMVIAASPEGILVSDKVSSSFITPYVEKMGGRPMYENKRWGSYKVLDYITYSDGVKSLTKHLSIFAGGAISYQIHKFRDEIWTIVDGEGEAVLDGAHRKVVRGDVIYIRKGQLHTMRAVSDLHFIEVQIGVELQEDDIERYEYRW